MRPRAALFVGLAHVVLAGSIVALAALTPAPTCSWGVARAALSTGDTAQVKTIFDAWDKLSIGNTPVGYTHTVTRRMAKPDSVIISTIFSETRMSRMGVTVHIRTQMEFRESSDGKLLAAESDTYALNVRTSCKARVQGDRIMLKSSVGGRESTKEVPLEEDLIGPHAVSQRIVKAGIKKGTNVTYGLFMPEFHKVVQSTVTIEGRETLTIGGKSLNLWKGTMVQDILPGVRTQVWMDNKADVLRSYSNLMGGVETIRVSREEALRALTSAGMPDMMTRFFVIPNRPIKNPRRVKEALYRIEGDAKVLDALSLEDRRQHVEKRTPQAIVVRIRALGDAPSASKQRPDPKYLAPSSYVQSDDPEIIRLAHKVAADVTTPLDKAKRLEQWVSENMTRKNLTIGFASAKEVLVSRQGDCTEHAVLLAALLRAENIPSRVVVGLTYWQGKFAYHMWTEAFLNDWTALDATLCDKMVDATHIKFTATALETASAMEPFLSLARVMGSIKLIVEEVKE